MMDERYRHKDIIGFEGLYALGEHGKVYSYRSEKYLKPIKNKKDTSMYVGFYIKRKRVKRLYLTEKLMNTYFGEEEDKHAN